MKVRCIRKSDSEILFPGIPGIYLFSQIYDVSEEIGAKLLATNYFVREKERGEEKRESVTLELGNKPLGTPKKPQISS